MNEVGKKLCSNNNLFEYLIEFTFKWRSNNYRIESFGSQFKF